MITSVFLDVAMEPVPAEVLSSPMALSAVIAICIIIAVAIVCVVKGMRKKKQQAQAKAYTKPIEKAEDKDNAD